MKIIEFTLLKNTEDHVYASIKRSYFFGLFSRTVTVANTSSRYGINGDGWFYLNNGEQIKSSSIWPAIRAYKAQAALAATLPKEEK